MVNDRNQLQDPLCLQLKRFIVASLHLKQVDPAGIADDEPIIGGSLGLDSLDVLELTMNLEDEFDIKISNQAESCVVLANVASLADFVRAHSFQARLLTAWPRRQSAAPMPLGRQGFYIERSA